jgi:DNA helicase-2/ATP-dependent DNA helicase PcrA
VSRPNPEQDRLAALPIGNVLVIAPAGCGKTEALAARAKALIDRAEVVAPRKVMALTFSNKARDNLRARMRKVLGPLWYRRVHVMNIHGLAARVVKSHGKVQGIAPDLEVRSDSWHRRQLKELGIDFTNSLSFDLALRLAKDGPFDDDEVERRLSETRHEAAIEYERRLRAEGKLDYDDLLRHAARLLNRDDVARLYRAHCGAVLLDEVQDLSMLHYSIVRGIGADRVTYAGDEAQGVYGFAGAQPADVFRAIGELQPTKVEFTLSYRSSPAVLRAVNALAAEMGTTQLECAEPENWPDEGQVVFIDAQNTDLEAEATARTVSKIQQNNARATIGIIGRRGSRMDALRRAIRAAGLSFEDWGEPMDVPEVAELLRRHVREAVAPQGSEKEKLSRLEAMCLSSIEPSDVDTRSEITMACARLADLTDSGLTLVAAVAKCRTGDDRSGAVTPGIHLLTGHKGKGQEFDWAVVVGLEEGHVPDFRNPDDPEELRILHVMVSRAKYGLVVTRSQHTATRYGWREATPSRWARVLRASATAIEQV